MHYYQFNIGDYAKSTKHLTLLEDLAYRRLLDIYYDTEKPLISNVKQLARIAGMSEYIDEINNVLSDFFTETEEGFTQKKTACEIEAYQAKAGTARVNGKLGGRPKGEHELKTMSEIVIPKDAGKNHFLYLIYDTSKNEMKIGETKNLIQRRYDIKRPSRHLKIIDFWLMQTVKAQALENEILKEFYSYSIGGDWFVYSKEVEIEIVSFISKKTQSDILANQQERQLKPNYKPLTINQEPLTINQELSVKDTGTKAKRFVPPTLDQIRSYCNERLNNVDANKFIDHYTSNGWLVGKNKMKDWKAAIRTWEKSSFDRANNTPQQRPVSTTEFFK
jgi:uncharacterized protein YdaU (DUF1376 family)